MLSKEVKDRLQDFFEGFELVEFLQTPIEEIVERFEDEIEAALDDIEELIGVRDG